MTELNTIWIAVLAIAAPVVGVVGFALQLKNVRKLKLENRKLTLEIEALEESSRKANSRIVIPTTEEVERISRDDELLMSRRGQRSSPNLFKTKLSLGEVALLFVGAVVLLYLVYDLYRLGIWLVSWASIAGPFSR